MLANLPVTFTSRIASFLPPSHARSYALLSFRASQGVLYSFYEILSTLHQTGIPFFTNLIDVEKVNEVERLKGKHSTEHWSALMVEGRKFHHMMRILLHPGHKLSSKDEIVTSNQMIARLHELQSDHARQFINWATYTLTLYTPEAIDHLELVAYFRRSKNVQGLDEFFNTNSFNEHRMAAILLKFFISPADEMIEKAFLIKSMNNPPFEMVMHRIARILHMLVDTKKTADRINEIKEMVAITQDLIKKLNGGARQWAQILFITVMPSKETINEAMQFVDKCYGIDARLMLITVLFGVEKNDEALYLLGKIVAPISPVESVSMGSLIEMMVSKGFINETLSLINKIPQDYGRHKEDILLKFVQSLLAKKMFKKARHIIEKMHYPEYKASAILEFLKVFPSKDLMEKLQYLASKSDRTIGFSLLLFKGKIKEVYAAGVHTRLDGLDIMFEQPLSIQFLSRYKEINQLIDYFKSPITQFTFCSASRTLNADINRKTAKYLYEQAVKAKSPAEVAFLFTQQNVRHVRRKIILETKIRDNPDFVDRDINSDTLNIILHQIRQVSPITPDQQLDVIKTGLKAYEARVQNLNQSGFFIDKARREKSRQANLALEKDLLEVIENPQTAKLTLHSLFNKERLQARRQRLIDAAPSLKEARAEMNSAELEEVITLARQYFP